MHDKIFFFIMLSFFLISCQSIPEKIDKQKINNPKFHAELKPFELEIVEVNYNVEKQAEREKEYIQKRNEVEKNTKKLTKKKKRLIKMSLKPRN